MQENIALVYKEQRLPQDNDFGATVANLRSKKPEVIIALLLHKNGLFVKKLGEASIKTPIVSHYWIQSSEQVQIAGSDNLERVIFPEVNANQPRFREKFKEIFPSVPDNPPAFICYVTLAAILEAAKAPAALESEENLRKALVEIKKIQLLDGELVFKNREVILPMTVKTFRNGVVTDYNLPQSNQP